MKETSLPLRLLFVLHVFVLPVAAGAMDRFDADGLKAMFVGIGLFFFEIFIFPAIIVALICLGIRTLRGFFNF